MSKTVQEKAEKLYLEDGWEYPALAKKFKVSERTVRRWADAGNWKTRRTSQTIASQALAEEVSEQLDKPIPPRSVRVAMKGLDRNQIFEAAIASLHAAAPDAEIKSQEAAYGQLVKIVQVQQQMEHQERMAELEYRLKEADLALKQRQLNPLTIEDWADQGASFSDKAEVLWEAIKAACARALGS